MNIYLDDNIYEGVSEAFPLEQCKEAYTELPVIGEHNFKEYQTVKEGVDYEKVEKWNSTHTNYKIIAVPTPSEGAVERKEEGEATAKFHGEISKVIFLSLLDYIDYMKLDGWEFIKHERTDLSNGNIRIDYELKSN